MRFLAGDIVLRNYSRQSIGGPRDTLVSVFMEGEVRSGSFPPDDKKQMEVDISTAEGQLNAPKPNKNILTEAFLSIQRIFEGAVGGAIGSGLAAQAAKMLPHLFQ